MEIKKIAWGENTETQNIKNLRTKVFVEEQGISNEIVKDEDDKRCIQLIGVEKGNLIGHLRIYRMADDTYKIQRVCIDKNYRKYGFGKALISQAEEEIKKAGGQKVMLWSQKLVKFYYEKLGYTSSQNGKIINYYKNPHIEMWKQV